MADWKIHRKHDTCTACDRPFEEGEALYSLLRITEEGLAREDRCGSCFREANEGDPDAPIWWRTRRRAEGSKRLSVDFEAVEGLFLALEGRPEERLRELRYLLSLLLMRKRRLKLVRVKRRADDEVMVVRRPRRKDELEVEVFDLTAERAGELRAELEGLFEGAPLEDVMKPPPPPSDAGYKGGTTEGGPDAAPEPSGEAGGGDGSPEADREFPEAAEGTPSPDSDPASETAPTA